MDLAKLGNLKMKMVAENDFRPIWDYFFDHFAEDDEFLEMGGPIDITDHPVRTSILLSAAMAFAGNGMRPDKTLPPPDFMVKHIESEHFMHGTLILQGKLGVFFYFDDLDVGMLAMDFGTGSTSLLRVSVRPDRSRPAHR